MIIFILTSNSCPHCINLRNSNGVVLTNSVKQSTTVHSSFGEYRYNTFVDILKIDPTNIMLEAHLIRGQIAEINSFAIRSGGVVQTTFRPNPQGKTTYQIRNITDKVVITEKVVLFPEVPEWNDYVSKSLPMKQIMEHIRGIPAFSFINETLWNESIARANIPLYMRLLGHSTSNEGTFSLTPDGSGPRNVKDAVEYFTSNPDQLLPAPLRKRTVEEVVEEVVEDVKVIEGVVNNKPVQVYRGDIVFVPKRRRR